MMSLLDAGSSIAGWMEQTIPLGRRVLCSGVTAKYAWIAKQQDLYPISVICRALEVSRAGFYHWRQRPPSQRQQEDERLKVAIRAAHSKTRQTYGATRLQAELAAEGFHAGRDRIGRLHREMGLSCKQKRKFKATTHSSHSLPVAENHLGQVFAPTVTVHRERIDMKSGMIVS